MSFSVRGVCAAVFMFLVAVSAAAQQSADMFVSKSGPTSATVGSNITFTVTVENFGPDDAANATLTDVLPADATFVSNTQTAGPTFTCSNPLVGSSGTITCSIATLTAGTAAQFDIVVNVTANAAGTTLINSASVSSTTTDDNGENNTSITGTNVAGGNLADLGIVKTGPASAPANSDVTYHITVTNGSANDATNVSWTDTLPVGTPAPPSQMTFVSFTQDSGPAFSCGPGITTTCTIATMPAGSTATFTLVGHIPAGTPTGKEYTNVATMKSDNDPNPENDSSATALTVSSADVGVTKSAPATAIAGGATFDYVVTVSNAGPDSATDVSFTDALPAGITFVSLTQDTGPAATCNSGQTVTCTISLLGNGASAQFTIKVQAAATVANGTVVNNTATVTASSSDPNSANNSSTASTTINAQADVSILKTGPATAFNGNDVTYTITVANAGPSAATNVSMTEGNPPGLVFVSESQTSGPTFNCTITTTTSTILVCTIASLAPGASATFNVVMHIPSGAGVTSMGNDSFVTATTADPNSNNNRSSVSTIVSSQADVSVTKSAPAAALAGSNITYTITVANGGPSDAASVTLNDVLPAGTTFVSESQSSGPTFNCTTGATVTCTIASFAAGTSATFNVTVHLAGSIADGTTVTNTATVSSTTTDPAPLNNTASASTVVGVNADLAVTKSGPATTPSNTTAVYNVTATNAGPSNAASVTLTESVPAGMTFVSAIQTSGPAFSCSGTGPIVCTIASFASGASATFQFTFGVPNTAVAGTVTSNTVTISSPTPDPAPSNNTASVTTTIGQSIPALSPLAMMLLATFLAGVGWMAARR